MSQVPDTQVPHRTYPIFTYNGLAVGYFVCVPVLADMAPATCYIGQVIGVDSRGVRLRLLNQHTGEVDGWDVFVPWHTMGVCLVATPDHNLDMFMEEAVRWKVRMLNKRHRARNTDDQSTVLTGATRPPGEVPDAYQGTPREQYYSMVEQERDRSAQAGGVRYGSEDYNAQPPF